MISHFALGHLSRLLHFKVAARARALKRHRRSARKKREVKLNKQHTLAHPCIFAIRDGNLQRMRTQNIYGDDEDDDDDTWKFTRCA